MIHKKTCCQSVSNPEPPAFSADTLPSELHCLSIAAPCRRLNLLWRRVRVAAPSVTVCVKRQASSVEFKRRVSIVSVSVKRRVSVVSVKRQCPCQRRVIFLSPSSEPPLLWPSSPLILLSPSSQRRFSVAAGSVDSASTSALSSASVRISVESSQPPLPVL